jgi:hypothetical protein
MLQVWPVGGAADSPGALRGRVGRGSALQPLRLPVPAASPWQDCSAGFRHAALIAGAGLWLGESEVEPRPLPRQLGQLAAAENRPTGEGGEKRAEGLEVILRAVGIAAE